MDLWCRNYKLGLNMANNKVLFLTGGDKGIGRAIVERMALQFETVVFTYNTNIVDANEITTKYKNIHSFQCNLKNREQTLEIAQKVKESYGMVDVLINNAGYDNDAVFSKMESNQWDDVIDINLKSIYNLTHAFLPGMIEKQWGRIVNVTSIAGFTGAFGKSNYAAAKAGIVGFTKSLAMELGRKGI